MSGKTVGIWIEGEGRATKSAINKVMLKHRKNIHESMAIAMNNTRIRAHDRIIPNIKKIRNPYASRRIQPPVPGRLTERTGKIQHMLKHSTSSSNPLRGWTGIGTNKAAKQRSVAFISRIAQKRLTGKTDRYVGTIKVDIRGDSVLFSTYAGRPRESTRTLAVRFNWETGIRGEKRSIFKPAYKRTEWDMRRLVAQKDAAIRGVI